MANTFLTPSIIAREALAILENNLVFANLVHRNHATEWRGAKKGDTISIRKPASFTAQEFTSTITAQNATETSVSLVLEKHFDVSFNVTSKDWTLNLEDFSAQLIRPAVVALAQAVDAYVAAQYVGSHIAVGVAGDPPDSLDDIASIDEAMNDSQVPLAGRVAVVNARAKRDLFQVTQFSDADKRGDQGTALRDASMGRFMGFDWFMDQNIKAHTAGAGSGYLVNGTPAIGATTLPVDTGTGALVVGDLLTIAGVPGTYRVTTAFAGGAGNILIEPGLRAAPADNAAVTKTASHVANLAFTRNAIALATVPLELPDGASKAMVMADRGLGIRYVSDYDTSTKTDTISLDLLCGAKMIDGRLAVRILG